MGTTKSVGTSGSHCCGKGLIMMFSSLLLASLSGLLLASPAPQDVCLGCPQAVEVNQDIVDFVFSELSLGDCQKQAVGVENFQSQVVAGYRYKFDLVLGESSECGLTGEAKCHVEVYNVPWMGTTEIIWDATSCKTQQS